MIREIFFFLFGITSYFYNQNGKKIEIKKIDVFDKYSVEDRFRFSLFHNNGCKVDNKESDVFSAIDIRFIEKNKLLILKNNEIFLLNDNVFKKIMHIDHRICHNVSIFKDFFVLFENENISKYDYNGDQLSSIELKNFNVQADTLITENFMYFITTDNTLICLDVNTFKILWFTNIKLNLARDIYSIKMISYKDYVVLCSKYGVFVIDKSSGKIVTSLDIKNSDIEAFTIDDILVRDDKLLVFGCNDNYVLNDKLLRFEKTNTKYVDSKNHNYDSIIDVNKDGYYVRNFDNIICLFRNRELIVIDNEGNEYKNTFVFYINDIYYFDGLFFISNGHNIYVCNEEHIFCKSEK